MNCKLRVLLVEDTPISAKMAEMVLSDFGCTVDIVFNGKDAITQFKNQYDVIFVDIGLPDIDGYTVTETIRQKYTDELTNPVIIALTAHRAKEMHYQSKRSGMDDFIVKPLTASDCTKLFKKHNLT